MQSGGTDQIQSSGHSLEADMRSLLGDAGYAKYQDFSKNEMADQTLLMTMKNDFVDNPLTNTQQQQLLEAMKAARQSVTASSPLDPGRANGADKLAMMDQVLQQQDQMNQKVLQQAAAFLSPDRCRPWEPRNPT